MVSTNFSDSNPFGLYDTNRYITTSEYNGLNCCIFDCRGTSVSVNLRGNEDTTTIYELKCNLFDLTDWYGAGREPSTVAEFKERFYRDYYGSCSKSIRLTENMINAEPIYGYNQILSPNRHSTQTINNITITNNGDGSYTINGTATATAYDIIEDYPFITGHKYYIKQNYSDSIQHNLNS